MSSQTAPAAPTTSQASNPNGAATNADFHHDIPPAGKSVAAAAAKKGKTKKNPDPDEKKLLLDAKIAALEQDAAGQRDQDAEIVEGDDVFCLPSSSARKLTNTSQQDREVKKANREFNNQTSKLNDVQKIDALSKRCTDLLAEMKRLERENLKNKKRGDQLQKEKDHLRNENAKNLSLKEKLEKLCRELQRENNRLKGENKTLTDTSKSNHEKWDGIYESMMWQLQDYQEKKDNPQAQVVNMEIDELFRQRFKSLIDQYELRELHFHSLMRTKELEVQFNMARFERERKAAETEVIKSRALHSQVATFSKTEAELRSQLNVYVDKFKQVEDTLNNSNDLFLTFRKEMEEMSKKTKRLEKENTTLTRKHDLNNQNILKMAEERTKTHQELAGFRKKNEKLTNIINAMQKQGRGLAHGMAGVVEDSVEDDYAGGERDPEQTESEYEYEDESGEYDEDTEDDLHADNKPFGPVPPPASPAAANGILVNGAIH